MKTALSLLGSGYDPARKNAALFVGAAIHFKVMQEAFDSQAGLQRLLAMLRSTELLLRGPQLGDRGQHPGDMRLEKQVSGWLVQAR